ncbi:hypothetical protein U1Q18_021647, partial [Sarracenia purpurea var. burkii]
KRWRRLPNQVVAALQGAFLSNAPRSSVNQVYKKRAVVLGLLPPHPLQNVPRVSCTNETVLLSEKKDTDVDLQEGVPLEIPSELGVIVPSPPLAVPGSDLGK